MNVEGFDEQYEQSVNSKGQKNNEGKNKSNGEYEQLKKHYLNAYLTGDEREKDIVIRILPWSAEENIPFKTVRAHAVKIRRKDGKKGWQTLMCPKEEDPNAPCPFCDIAAQAKQLMFNSKSEDERKKYKEILDMNEAKTFCIARVVDRDDVASGVKFWLFKSGSQGPHGQIKKLRDSKLKDKIEIFDPYDGKDLRITLEKVKNGDREKTQVTITDVDGRSPIFPTEEEMIKWVDDTTDYKKLYPTKKFEELEIFAKGGYPIYSKELKKIVDKFSLDEELQKQAEEDKQKLLTQNPKDFSSFAKTDAGEENGNEVLGVEDFKNGNGSIDDLGY